MLDEQPVTATPTGGVALDPGSTRGGAAGAVVNVVREYMIVVVVIVACIVLALSSDVFLTKENILNVLENAAPIGILACALTFVTIAGEFDLSAGAMLILCGVVAAKLEPSVGVAVCFLLGILASLAAGVINGLLVTYFRINSFVCTLASGLMIAGLGLVITGGFLVAVTDQNYGDLAFNALAGVKWSVWIFAAFALACAFVLSRTRFGRWVYAVGGNVEAARLSGINTRLVKIVAFAVSGTAAGIAGVIVASKSGQAQAGDGISMVLQAFAAVVVGGTSVTGGRGAIWRTIFGVLFLALISNGFNLLSLNQVYQQIVQGGIILAAVATDALSRRRTV
ncbi:MAG: inner-rane translocator [Solirubrobacterales bacterium]|jgi:ribose transport system permease protein|nr:inner-rane translocator [Solirubrobacterales bacterium]